MASFMDQAIDNTIQGQVSSPGAFSPLSFLTLLAKVNDIISPWWSKTRDRELRAFAKSSDHLSGAIYNMCAKMTAIPVRVEARDKSVKSHVNDAIDFTDMLINGSQFGDGWSAFYNMFVEDLLSQDNGAFAEIIGPGDPAGELTGMPFSIAHLDAGRCVRTGDPKYPVIYEDTSGKRYKLHFTRVMFMSQQPSTEVRMAGVGFCAVSRSINATQNLVDISTYKQEKLGSRPPRQLMITGGGLDPEDIGIAVQMAERAMSGMGLTKFSKTIVAGNRNIVDPKIQSIDLASLPDGFNEKESTVIAMSVLAMAFGMDARELFPMMEGGASKADAIVQHMKQRGKGPGQILEMTEKGINAKLLPPQLRLVFDYQDDAQDRQAAEIGSIRGQSRQRDILSAVTNIRVERQKMVENGEISPEQFEELELSDGRLPDGLDVTILFESSNKDYVSMLSGVSETNYETKKQDIQKIILESRDNDLIKKARRALAAILWKIEKPLEEEQMREQAMEDQMMIATARANRPTGDGVGKKVGSQSDGSKKDESYQSEQGGRKLGKDETNIRGDMQSTKGL
jgi:hypothetical protein